MVQLLRNWLNGQREYNTGVALFSAFSKNSALIKLFRNGKTPYTNRRLQEELLAHYNQIKSPPPPTELPVQPSPPAPTLPSTESPVYVAAKREADKAFKEFANARARLFAMAAPDDFTDPNSPDKINQRRTSAIDVVRLYQKASDLYDRADYVKQTGRLPTDIEPEQPAYDALPNELVKQTLDNLRKNVNKMKKREPTAARLALIEKHTANIKNLEARWRSLKPR